MGRVLAVLSCSKQTPLVLKKYLRATQRLPTSMLRERRRDRRGKKGIRSGMRVEGVTVDSMTDVPNLKQTRPCFSHAGFSSYSWKFGIGHRRTRKHHESLENFCGLVSRLVYMMLMLAICRMLYCCASCSKMHRDLKKHSGSKRNPFLALMPQASVA